MMLWILGWYAALSLITFGFYGWDKRQARLSRWRIKERTLHLLELVGGWPGGLVAQRYFRHKWKKTKYVLIFWGIVVLHVAGWGIWIYRYRQ